MVLCGALALTGTYHMVGAHLPPLSLLLVVSSYVGGCVVLPPVGVLVGWVALSSVFGYGHTRHDILLMRHGSHPHLIHLLWPHHFVAEWVVLPCRALGGVLPETAAAAAVRRATQVVHLVNGLMFHVEGTLPTLPDVVAASIVATSIVAASIFACPPRVSTSRRHPRVANLVRCGVVCLLLCSAVDRPTFDPVQTALVGVMCCDARWCVRVRGCSCRARSNILFLLQTWLPRLVHAVGSCGCTTRRGLLTFGGRLRIQVR
jgi:hypothetical protein